MEKGKDHTLLLIILFLIGGLFAQAAHGTNNRKLKTIYWTIAIGIWVTLFLLAISLL